MMMRPVSPHQFPDFDDLCALFGHKVLLEDSISSRTELENFYAFILIPAAVARYLPHATQAEIEAMAAKPILDDIVPYQETDRVLPGSTDVGDVSWQVPTAQVFTACYPQGTVSHSWQLAACGQSPLVHKGLI
jgi:metal-dependent amidase/aminoacylase/carboxypeptidase family protein